MRTKTVIFILLSAFIFVMAEPSMPFFNGNGYTDEQTDSVSIADTLSLLADTAVVGDSLPADSLKNMSNEPDTTKMDSLELAIYKHNKHVSTGKSPTDSTHP